MMTLKYPQPTVQYLPCGGTSPVLFSLLPQGEAGISVDDIVQLQALGQAIAERLKAPIKVTCHPHRVGLCSNIALHLEDRLGKYIDILITVSGTIHWPQAEDYAHPRWYVTVPDSADALYLVLWLNARISREP